MAEEQKNKRSRGRPRKVPIEENERILTESSAETLKMSSEVNTSQEGTKKPYTLNDVQRSLTGLFQQVYGDSEGGLWKNLVDLNQYNPFLQNSRLKLINSYPATYEPTEISEFLKDPQYHEQELRQASAGLSASQYLYYKILREAADIPLFKHYILPPVLSSEEGYKNKNFDDEEEFVNKWLAVFNPTNTLKRVSLEVKREGKATYLFRQCIEEKKGKKSPKYVVWQKLPSQYVKLTAIGEFGYIASFNMLLFLNPAFSPEQYPDYIRNIWDDMVANNIVKTDKKKYSCNFNLLKKYIYNGNNGLSIKGMIESSMDNTYMYWVQLPQELCFTFASDTSNAWAAPDTMGLFNALQELTDYSTLAGLVASSPLTAILTGQAETIPNSQPGQDQTVISPHTMLALQNAFNSMVSGSISAFFAPFKDMKLQSLPDIPNAMNIKTEAVQNFISMAGEGGIISATDKPSVAMIKGAQLLTASQYDFVTRQYEAILNMQLQRWTGVKYDWKIKIWGDIYSFETSVKTIKEMVAGGASFLLPKLASAYDLTLRDIRGINHYLAANKIYDDFKTLSWVQNQITQENQAAEEEGAGRPALDDSEVENDSTAASKDAGNNVSDIKDFVAHNRCILCGGMVEDGNIICDECRNMLDNEDANNE